MERSLGEDAGEWMPPGVTKPTNQEPMSQETTWDGSSRENLLDTLRQAILGEVRLANRDHEDIIEYCREVYLEDECPEDEREEFARFAGDELERVLIRHAEEQKTWPPETDSDRLDRVEVMLRERGILLWQASPCCDTCTYGEIGDRIDAIDQQHPGFRSKLRGAAFFIDQAMADMLSESPKISVYLGYSWFSPDDSKTPPEIYEKNALGIAGEVCESLREFGFVPDWDGSFSKKIGLTLDWQRRTMLG